MNLRNEELLWQRSGGRCAICRRSVASPTRSQFTGGGLAGEAVPIRGRSVDEPQFVLPATYLDSYDNLVLLCTYDAAVARVNPQLYTSMRLRELRNETELLHRRRTAVDLALNDVDVLVHTAMFAPTSPPQFFIKIVNNSLFRDAELVRIWFASVPEVEVSNAARPLPAQISPGDTFETWQAVASVPQQGNTLRSVRVQLSDGRVVNSEPNSTVPPAGMIGGGGRSMDSLVRSVSSANHDSGDLVSKNWDIFICHASEDKAAVVLPFAQALRDLGLNPWVDKFEMLAGDSLRRKIDQGIALSKLGCVIVSPTFLARKQWTEWELDGLVSRSIAGEQPLLPVWHGVSLKEVRDYSSSLTNLVALDTAQMTYPEMAEQVQSVLQRALSD